MLRAGIILLSVLLASLANAATRFVAPTGTNTGACTASACLTLTYAYGQSAAGDRIEVGDGTYTDYTNAWGLKFTTNGSAGNPITVNCTNSVAGYRPCIIDGTGQTEAQRPACIYYYATQYNTIQGFQIRNCTQVGVMIATDGVTASNNIQILNNEIYNITNPSGTHTNGHGGQGIGNGGINAGSTLAGSGHQIIGNYIHDIGTSWDVAANGNGLDHGIYFEGNSSIIANNIVTNNLYGNGIQLSNYSTTITNEVVVNNTSTYNWNSGIVIWSNSASQSFVNLLVANNMLYGNGRNTTGTRLARFGLTGCAANGGITITSNLSYLNLTGTDTLASDWTQDSCGGGTATWTINNTPIQSDPMLKDYTNASGVPGFALRPYSPAIGAGVVNANAANDYFTTKRSGRPSIGAIEWVPTRNCFTCVER